MEAVNMTTGDFANRVLGTLNHAIVCLDREQRVVYLNASGEDLFGQSAAKAAGRRFDSLLSPVEPSSIGEKLALGVGAMTEHDAVITLASGESFDADYSIYPLGEAAGEVEIVVEIYRHQHHKQFFRNEMNQLQQQASKRLARGFAHEIKNPLGGIRGAAQLLQRELERPDWQEYTEIIISEVDRLQTLVNNMLVPESRLQRQLINIYEILEHISKIVQAAEPERIELVRDYDPSIPALLGDRDLLIQAFLNIARNAVQAIEERGTITIRTRIDRHYSIGNRTWPLVLQVDIHDTGRGISRDLADTIFLPMVTDKPDGSGLGLPIAQEIVNRHGGGIQLLPSPSGTTFRITLPLETP